MCETFNFCSQVTVINIVFQEKINKSEICQQAYTDLASDLAW